MNSKDFNLIAKSLRENLESFQIREDDARKKGDVLKLKAFEGRRMGVFHAIHNIAEHLEANHIDNFDKKLFLKKCGL